MKKGRIKSKHGNEVEANKALNLKEIKPEDYDALILPGGRAHEDVTRNFCERPVVYVGGFSVLNGSFQGG